MQAGPSRPDAIALAALAAAVARGEAGGHVRLRQPSQAPILATVAPLPERLARLALPGRRYALAVLRPLFCGQAGDQTGMLEAAFALTSAEAAVAEALAAGATPQEIAGARGVKASTVRTLLARAQDKTATRNLRDLVRLLASQR